MGRSNSELGGFIMPTSLTGNKISLTYPQIIHVNGGVTGTAKALYDGDGTATILKVSTSVVEISGNLTVAGTLTSVNTTNLQVDDSLIQLGRDNDSSDVVDIGFVGLYDAGGTDKYAGLFRDANDSGKFKLFIDSQEDLSTTNTINTSATGYAVATLVANLEAATVNIDGGNIDGTTIATSDITVGSSKTLNVSSGTLTTSQAQKLAIVQGVGANTDIGAYNFRASTLTADSQTSGRVAIYGTNGLLTEDSDLTFSGDTLTATKLGAFTATGAINFDSQNMTNVDIDSGTIDGITTLTVDNITINGSDINNSTGNFTFSHGGSEKLRITSDKVMFSVDAKVDANNSRDLGTSGARWKDLYLAGDANVSGAGSFGTLTASGDINFDSNTLFVDASQNNVGIGTNSITATSQLQIEADKAELRIKGTNDAASDEIAHLILEASSDRRAGITIEGDSNSIQAFIGRPYDTANTLVFETTVDGESSGTERMRITNNGIESIRPGTDNEAFGFQAGHALASGGNNNTMLGHTAGAVVSTGDNNTIIGSNSGLGLTTSNSNVLVGYRAMYRATTAADSNVAIGYESMGGNWGTADVNNCVAIGRDTLASTLTSAASQQVAVGDTALYSCTSGAENVAVGYMALADLTTGGSNVGLGFKAAQNLERTESHNIAIGGNSMENLKENHAGAEANHNIAIGTATLAAGNLGNGVKVNHNIAIGSNALNSTGTTQHEGTIAIGYNAGTAINDEEAEGSVLIGHEAGATITQGQANVGIGYQSLTAASGTGTDFNVAIGYQSAKTISGNSNGNVVVGYQAMETAAECDRNTVIGYRAFANASSGEDGNIVIGYSAGSAIRNGDSDENVIIGTGATGGSIARSVAIGAFSLQSTAGNAASDVIAIGHKSLKSMTTGSQNTCVGFVSGEDITTHSANTFLGYKAGTNVAGDHNTCIGASAGDAIISGEENICLGSNTDPSANDTDNAIVIGFNITGGGNQFSFGKASNVVSNTFTSDAAFSRSSDERLKTDIKDDTLGLDFIKELKTKTFKWKPSNEVPKELTEHYSEKNNMDTDVVMHGMIAQEVKEALDKAGVSTFGGWSEKSDGSQDISREMFVIPLIKAVQELSTKLTQLESKCNCE